MIENQSDNIDNKESDISDVDNALEDTSSPEDKIVENDELSSNLDEFLISLSSESSFIVWEEFSFIFCIADYLR